MRKRAAILLALLPFLLVACRAEPEPVLRVGSAGYPADQVSGLSGEQIHMLADLTAIAEAVARGEMAELGEPLIAREWERARLEALPLYLAAQEMGIGEEELGRAYAAAPEWELEVQHVVRLVPRWAPSAERAEARRIAEEVRRRAAAGEDFAVLAAEYSEEPGAAERGGRLQPGWEGSWVPPFWEAARALEPGEISPVVETEYGYHVLRLDDRRPMPFEEADRTRLLERLVPPGQARAAMERWVAGQTGELFLDPPALARARRHLEAGAAPDTLILARWPQGEYTAWDLAVYRASLDAEARERLDAADDASFGFQVEGDARETMWADQARAMEVRIPDAARTAAEREWERQAAIWSRALGLREGMREEEVRSAALRGLTDRGQEMRIARREIEGLRPLLRRRYPLSGEAAPPSPSAASSSEARKNARTG